MQVSTAKTAKNQRSVEIRIGAKHGGRARSAQHPVL